MDVLFKEAKQKKDVNDEKREKEAKKKAKKEERMKEVPRVKIFAGKAAVSYENAKIIIKLINGIQIAISINHQILPSTPLKDDLQYLLQGLLAQ